MDDKKPIDAYHSIFASRLRHLLDYHRMTQKTLAQVVGKTPQQISLYANGGSKPDSETLATIAKHFNVTSDYLLGLSDAYSIDGDMQAACKYTGLSEDAVRGIKLCSDIASAYEQLDTETESEEELAWSLIPLLQQSNANIPDLEDWGEDGQYTALCLCRSFFGIRMMIDLLACTVDETPYSIASHRVDAVYDLGEHMYELLISLERKHETFYSDFLSSGLLLMEYQCQKAFTQLCEEITEDIIKAAVANGKKPREIEDAELAAAFLAQMKKILPETKE